MESGRDEYCPYHLKGWRPINLVLAISPVIGEVMAEMACPDKAAVVRSPCQPPQSLTNDRAPAKRFFSFAIPSDSRSSSYTPLRDREE